MGELTIETQWRFHKRCISRDTCSNYMLLLADPLSRCLRCLDSCCPTIPPGHPATSPNP